MDFTPREDLLAKLPEFKFRLKIKFVTGQTVWTKVHTPGTSIRFQELKQLALPVHEMRGFAFPEKL